MPSIQVPFSCREYSKDYVDDEDKAKREHKGVWQGEFQEPAQWRRENKKGKASREAKEPSSKGTGLYT